MKEDKKMWKVQKSEFVKDTKKERRRKDSKATWEVGGQASKPLKRGGERKSLKWKMTEKCLSFFSCLFLIHFLTKRNEKVHEESSNSRSCIKT